MWLVVWIWFESVSKYLFCWHFVAAMEITCLLCHYCATFFWRRFYSFMLCTSDSYAILWDYINAFWLIDWLIDSHRSLSVKLYLKQVRMCIPICAWCARCFWQSTQVRWLFTYYSMLDQRWSMVQKHTNLSTLWHLSEWCNKFFFLSESITNVKGFYSSLWEPVWGLHNVTCHMRSHIVRCHLTQMSVHHLNPSQAGWYSIYLPRRDGRLSWPGWLVTYQDGLPVCRQSPVVVVVVIFMMSPSGTAYRGRWGIGSHSPGKHLWCQWSHCSNAGILLPTETYDLSTPGSNHLIATWTGVNPQLLDNKSDTLSLCQQATQNLSRTCHLCVVGRLVDLIWLIDWLIVVCHVAVGRCIMPSVCWRQSLFTDFLTRQCHCAISLRCYNSQWHSASHSFIHSFIYSVTHALHTGQWAVSC